MFPILLSLLADLPTEVGIGDGALRGSSGKLGTILCQLIRCIIPWHLAVAWNPVDMKADFQLLELLCSLVDLKGISLARTRAEML